MTLKLSKPSNDVDEESVLSKFRCLVEQSNKTANYKLDNATLLKFLRSRSYDLQKSHQLLTNYLKIVNDRPDLFSWRNELVELARKKIYYHHPIRNPDGSVLVVLDPRQWDTSKDSFMDWYPLTLFFTEITLMDEAVQRSGLVSILDTTRLGLNHAYSTGVNGIRLSNQITDNCYPHVIKGVHNINLNYFASMAFNFGKPFLSSELRQKLHFYGTNHEELHAIIPKSIIPKSLGGTGQDFSGDYYADLLLKRKDDVVQYWESLRTVKK